MPAREATNKFQRGVFGGGIEVQALDWLKARRFDQGSNQSFACTPLRQSYGLREMYSHARAVAASECFGYPPASRIRPSCSAVAVG